jgi:hypothetical protein
MEGGAHDDVACVVRDIKEGAAVTIFAGMTAARDEDDGDLDVD